MNEVLEDVFERTRRLLYYGIGGWLLGLVMMLRLPDADDIDPRLIQEPIQGPTSRGEIHFKYEGQEIRVMPVLSYEINGLVVSHNDPGEWYRFDLIHDSQSINTRDICLIWGDNLKTNAFHHVSFSNDDRICNWSYGSSVRMIKDNEISNNHLITANDDIREQIANLHVGDQVAIKGRLAYYAEERWGLASLRSSSLTRDDTGVDSGEIIFVESLTVLHSYNYFWALLHQIGYWICVGMISLRAAVFAVPKQGLHLPGFVKRIIAMYKP
jgi:hypothetical protein